jgi:hypothetical protein
MGIDLPREIDCCISEYQWEKTVFFDCVTPGATAPASRIVGASDSINNPMMEMNQIIDIRKKALRHFVWVR